MSRFIQEQARSEPKRYQAIRCFTHKVFVASKAEVKKRHKGCEVHYTDKDGNLDED